MANDITLPPPIGSLIAALKFQAGLAATNEEFLTILAACPPLGRGGRRQILKLIAERAPPESDPWKLARAQIAYDAKVTGLLRQANDAIGENDNGILNSIINLITSVEVGADGKEHAVFKWEDQEDVLRFIGEKAEHGSGASIYALDKLLLHEKSKDPAIRPDAATLIFVERLAPVGSPLASEPAQMWKKRIEARLASGQPGVLQSTNREIAEARGLLPNIPQGGPLFMAVLDYFPEDKARFETETAERPARLAQIAQAKLDFARRRTNISIAARSCTVAGMVALYCFAFFPSYRHTLGTIEGINKIHEAYDHAMAKVCEIQQGKPWAPGLIAQIDSKELGLSPGTTYTMTYLQDRLSERMVIRLARPTDGGTVGRDYTPRCDTITVDPVYNPLIESFKNMMGGLWSLKAPKPAG